MIDVELDSDVDVVSGDRVHEDEEACDGVRNDIEREGEEVVETWWREAVISAVLVCC